MSYQIIRRDCGATTVRCPSCGSIESVWCTEPAGSEVPTRTGLRWACSRCAPYVRVPVTKQPMGNDSPLCAKCDLPISDRLHADDHMFTEAATDCRWRDPLLFNNTTTKETKHGQR